MDDWIKQFVANHHPDLGRSGSVCPFVKHALQIGTLRMEESDIEPNPESLHKRMLEAKTRFLLDQTRITSESERTHSSVVIVFPRFTTPEHAMLMDSAQTSLKIEYMKDGLMIGQFHPYQDSPGLHNSNFRPNRTPASAFAFVIRNMVSSDSIFIYKNLPTDKVPLAAGAVLERFSSVLPPGVIEELKSATRDPWRKMS